MKTTNNNTGMKQMVVNKYQKVMATLDHSFVGVYSDVTAALEGIGKLYKDIVWCEKIEKVRIYGVVTESNGYEHSCVCPIYVCGTDRLWDGKRPDIHEICILHARQDA